MQTPHLRFAAFYLRSTAGSRALHSTTRGKMSRDYNSAIAALNTLQSNFAIVDKIRKSGRGMNVQAIPEMIEWCKRIGYEPSEFDRLNIIHIAGTKGKGSTSAFINSILNQYSTSSSANAPRKIGLYTSPHLQSVRERIRINGAPISEALFTRYFYEIWDRLEDAAARLGPGPGAEQPAEKPVYFRYLTLMMFHTYLCEGVDTAVVECGIGGEHDSTNIIQEPVVSAVTSLGIDHVAMLGGTVEEIAWHKSGVFKAGARCRQVYTVDNQPGTSTDVLRRRAEERDLELVCVPRHPSIDDGSVKLGLDADFQKSNASVAVAVAAAHLRALGVPDIPDPTTHGPLPDEFIKGLAATQLGGRCETRKEGNITWYIDGGHTLESIKLAAEWFGSQLSDPSTANQKRILLFNQQTRDASALATQLYKTLRAAMKSDVPETKTESLFHNALFSANVTFTETGAGPGRYKADLISLNTSSHDVSALTVQRGLADMWLEIDKGADIEVDATIQAAVESVRRIADLAESQEIAVFVTGSLHLVGGVLEVLETIPRS